MRPFTPALLTAIVVVIIVLIGVSPLALGGVRGISDDWEGLSFIGQAYGAVSALLAGFALAGVIATLIVQAREMRISRELALRDSNSELLRMAMDNREYAECWGANLSATGSTAQRQSMYTNMILSQWEMAYESHAIDDVHLRALASRLFVGRVGWEFWSRVRGVRLETAETGRSRRFHRIVDEEFHGAVEPAAQRSGHDRRDRRAGLRSLIMVGLAIGGAVTALAIHRRGRFGRIRGVGGGR